MEGAVEGQPHFPEQRLEGSMMGWPPVLNKHDPPTKCWSEHYNVICGRRCEPQETCGSALFNNTQILIFFWYKKSKLLSESLKSRNYSAIEFSQQEINAGWARIWFRWQNWKCVILLFSPAGSKYGFGGVQRQIFVLPTSQSYFASQHCSNIFSPQNIAISSFYHCWWKGSAQFSHIHLTIMEYPP